MDKKAKPQVCLLASPEASPGVLYGIHDVMSTVGVAYGDMVEGNPGQELLDIKIVAKSDEPFRCVGGVRVEPHISIEQIRETDVVVVCDMYLLIDGIPTGRYLHEVAWLKRMHANKAFLASVCSGSNLLMETGLLNGCEVTGHWAYRHMVAEHYPEVEWREDSIINFSAESNRLITTGGVTSWQDLTIYLIERLCGLQQAAYTAKVHLLSAHTEGQLPFAAMTQRNQTSDAVISECQKWMTDNIQSTNPVAQMAAHSGLQPRTFARRFREATSYQPIDYVQGLRVEAAKDKLLSENTRIDDIAYSVGYEDPASFCRLFKRKVGITPAMYRKKFVGIARF